MKKIKILLIIILVLLTACCNLDTGDNKSMLTDKNLQQSIISHHSINVFNFDGTYFVELEDYLEDSRCVIFSEQRESSNAKGVSLVNVEDISSWVGRTLSDLVKEYGKVHLDFGSGFYLPAYITDDAYLVFFGLDSKSEIIDQASKLDLLSGEVVVQYNSWQNDISRDN